MTDHRDHLERLREAIRCLALEVPEAVHRDVHQKVEAALAALEAECEHLRRYREALQSIRGQMPPGVVTEREWIASANRIIDVATGPEEAPDA